MKFLATIDAKKPLGLNFGSDFNLQRWNEWCKLNIGKGVKIEQPKQVRSLTQNAFYWAWLAKVERETGNESDDMHEYGKTKFLPKRLIRIKGKKNAYDVETAGTTTKLSKLEFGEYMEKFPAHVQIPLPTKEEIEAMGYISNY